MTKRAEAAHIQVRRATVRDAERMAPLAGQLGYPSTPAQIAARLEDVLALPEHTVWVAESGDGALAGFADIFMMRTVESDVRVEIAGLVVDQAYRGKGVGRRLMEQAEQWAREKGCPAVTLRSNVIREDAHRFYETLGYQVIKTQKSFRKMLSPGAERQARRLR